MADEHSLSDIAAVTGSNGFGGGSSWIVLILLFAMIWGGGFGFGGNGVAAATGADIQRAVDLNSIQQGQANIAADVQRTTYETISAVKDSAYNNLSEIRDNQALMSAGFANLQNCCCDLKGEIAENRYLAERNASNIMANDTANTQKILDAISTNRMADMQNQINQLQLANAVAGVVKYPMASTYCSGSNPFCGCSMT